MARDSSAASRRDWEEGKPIPLAGSYTILHCDLELARDHPQNEYGSPSPHLLHA